MNFTTRDAILVFGSGFLGVSATKFTDITQNNIPTWNEFYFFGIIGLLLYLYAVWKG